MVTGEDFDIKFHLVIKANLGRNVDCIETLRGGVLHLKRGPGYAWVLTFRGKNGSKRVRKVKLGNYIVPFFCDFILRIELDIYITSDDNFGMGEFGYYIL